MKPFQFYSNEYESRKSDFCALQSIDEAKTAAL